MSLIKEDDQAAIKDRLGSMNGAAHMVFFTQSENPPDHSDDMKTVLGELANLSDHLSVDVHDFEKEPETAAKYGVDRMPAIVLTGSKDFGVRYYGMPFGHEFTAFIEDIIDVANGESGLTPVTRERIAALPSPVHLRVFSTPT